MKGMVVCPHPLAAEEGAKALKRGGNAVDAAVTTAFVQGVIDPQMCGIGGFGSFHIYMAGTGEDRMIQFPGTAGSRVVPDMWEKLLISEPRQGYGYVLKGSVNDIGYASVGTPGWVIGMYEGLTNCGTMSWEAVIEPAIGYASEGFQITPNLRSGWLRPSMSLGMITSMQRFNATKACARIYTNNGEPLEEGYLLVQKDMAESLRRLASYGPDYYYRGEMAKTIAEDMEKNGGFVTEKDLKEYKPRWQNPLSITYGDYTITSNHGPGGGITLLQMLKILEGYDLAKMGHNSPEYIHTLSMAMLAALRDRKMLVGDPEFVEVPVDRLLSKERAQELRSQIDRGEKITVPRWSPQEHPDTTQVTVVDRDGNCVSLTHSLGASSGVVTEGLGFMYNNAMNCFDPIPGGVNSIVVGKARVDNTSPTIVFKDGKPVLVIGAPGGTRIMTGVLQCILNILEHEMSAQEAVFAPRFDCQTDVIDVEARIPKFICDEVEAKGHEVVRALASYGLVSRVHAIVIDRERDRLYGGADPSGGGGVISE